MHANPCFENIDRFCQLADDVTPRVREEMLNLLHSFRENSAMAIQEMGIS